MKTLSYLFLLLGGLSFIMGILKKYYLVPAPADPVTFLTLTQTFILFSIAFSLADLADRKK